MQYCEINESRGIILITVLLFLNILTLLGITLFQMAFLEERQAHAMWQRQVAESLSEQALRVAENKLHNMPTACQVPIAPLATILANLQSLQSCTGNLQTFQYYYAVESLGIDPCAYIQLPSKKQMANYYRITLLGVSGDIKVVLQSTLIVPIDDDGGLSCRGIERVVSAGRQSWLLL